MVLLPITIIILYSKSYNTIWISKIVLLGKLGCQFLEAKKNSERSQCILP